MSMKASYLQRGGDEERIGMDWVPESSRRSRVLPLYALFRTLGGDGIADIVRRNPGRFKVLGWAAGQSHELLVGQIREFMPPLAEGSLMYMPNTLPSISLTQQRRLLQVEDSILMTYPEVASVWGKAGRALAFAAIRSCQSLTMLPPRSCSAEASCRASANH